MELWCWERRLCAPFPWQRHVFVHKVYKQRQVESVWIYVGSSRLREESIAVRQMTYTAAGADVCYQVAQPAQPAQPVEFISSCSSPCQPRATKQACYLLWLRSLASHQLMLPMDEILRVLSCGVWLMGFTYQGLLIHVLCKSQGLQIFIWSCELYPLVF